jgi:hypothetical protein
MNLATRLAENFTTNVRKRGQDYYWQRRVRIEYGSASEVGARVKGSNAYDVSLDWKDGRLSVWCDCPYFVDSGLPCKHLWAAILAADGQGYLSAAASAADLVLDCDGINLDVELDFRNQDVSRIPSPTESAKLPAPKPPGWRAQFTDVCNARARVPRSGDAWPAKREILYVVDVPSSLSKAGLVLSLQSRDRKADGSCKQQHALTMKREQLARLPLLEDREILSALAGGKQYYAYGYMDSYDRVPESFLVPITLFSMRPRPSRTRIPNRPRPLACCTEDTVWR